MSDPILTFHLHKDIGFAVGEMFGQTSGLVILEANEHRVPESEAFMP